MITNFFNSKIVLILLIVNIVTCFYFYNVGFSNAKRDFELEIKKQNGERLKLEIEAKEKIIEIERKKRDEIDSLRTTYEQRIQAAENAATAVGIEFDRLRVKRCASVNVPAAAAAAAGTDETGTGNANGVGEVEVDLNGVAREIIRLGEDLDKCRAKVTELQKLVSVYTF